MKWVTQPERPYLYKGEFFKYRGELFMLGIAGRTPYAIHMGDGNVLKSIKAFNRTWYGLTKEQLTTAFPGFKEPNLEYGEFTSHETEIEEPVLGTAVLGSEPAIDPAIIHTTTSIDPDSWIITSGSGYTTGSI